MGVLGLAGAPGAPGGAAASRSAAQRGDTPPCSKRYIDIYRYIYVCVVNIDVAQYRKDCSLKVALLVLGA
jgi:hypothetical protein